MFKRRPLNNGNNNNGQPQNQKQGPKQGQKRRGRNHRRRSHGRPQPPPAYFQRDVLLIANRDTAKSIEEVRLRFDPLSKKIPAHITILFPEPAAKITNDILKKVGLEKLPPLSTLTFHSIQIMDDKYLWLIPDEESATRLKEWHALFSQQLTDHTQGEKYEPHLTLGYIPRKTPEDEALTFAKNLISTPLTLKFDGLLLEEFSEDQNSRSLDRCQVPG